MNTNMKISYTFVAIQLIALILMFQGIGIPLTPLVGIFSIIPVIYFNYKAIKENPRR